MQICPKSSLSGGINFIHFESSLLGEYPVEKCYWLSVFASKHIVLIKGFV